jgi:hypothetical protein
MADTAESRSWLSGGREASATAAGGAERAVIEMPPDTILHTATRKRDASWTDTQERIIAFKQLYSE